ncbi:MAG: energy transducer TonB [Bacteroidetes bacterium]|nr:energy transducer TonB [Bacteroidota bacterium]MCL1969182.1 energy transducer TonB [Bacteroidota bacterium]
MIDVNAPVTDPPPPPSLEQPKNYKLDIVDNNTKITLDSVPWNTESNEGDVVPDYEPVPIVNEVPDEPPRPVKFPEKMPKPVDGFDNMYAFLRSNLHYPEIPRTLGISGTVLVEFVVERDGSITNVTVAAGVSPELDKEAVRVVKLMPRWKPGEQMGKTVRCSYSIPIKFTIH